MKREDSFLCRTWICEWRSVLRRSIRARAWLMRSEIARGSNLEGMGAPRTPSTSARAVPGRWGEAFAERWGVLPAFRGGLWLGLGPDSEILKEEGELGATPNI